jgi:hypothetical protein
MRKGDAPETFWLLKRDSPICVDQTSSQPDFNPGSQRSLGCVAKSMSGKRVQGAHCFPCSALAAFHSNGPGIGFDFIKSSAS